MDFEKLTIKAQEAVHRAQQLAMEQQQQSIVLNPVLQNKGQGVKDYFRFDLL